MTTWGWKGRFGRGLEFPNGRTVARSPSGRATIRYNDQAKEVELSADGLPYRTVVTQASPDPLTQSNFYINSITGDDNNDGATSSTALKTINEYLNRIGTGTVIVPGDGIQRVYCSGVFDEGEYVFRGRYSYGVEFYGERTVIGSGSITGVQVWDTATNADGQILDSSIPTSWTDSGYVGKMVVLTSGANLGAVGWVGKDLGSKTARHSQFARLYGFSVVNPAIGDDYEVVSLTTIKGDLMLDMDAGAWGAAFQDFNFQLDDGGIRSTGGAFTFITACDVDGTTSSFGFISASGFILDMLSSKVDLGVGRCDVSRASVHGYVFCLIGARLVAENGSNLEISDSYLQADLSVNASCSIWANNNAMVTCFQGAIGFFDEDNASVAALRASRGGNIRFYSAAKIFGTNNACSGLQINACSAFFYPDGDDLADHVDITTTGTEVNYGGIATTYASVVGSGVLNAANNAAIVSTA